MESNQIPYQSFTNGKYFGLHNLILKLIKDKSSSASNQNKK